MNLLILFYAIVAVESGGNLHAVGDNGRSVGPAQIQEGVVKDCNRILGKEVFTLADRTSFDKSYRMFVVYTNHYGAKYGLTDEVRARVWERWPERTREESYGEVLGQSTITIEQTINNMNTNKSPLPNPVTKIYVRVNCGMVTDVYSDNPNVEVEIIDLDNQDELLESLMDDRDCQIRERIGSDLYVIY